MALIKRMGFKRVGIAEQSGFDDWRISGRAERFPAENHKRDCGGRRAAKDRGPTGAGSPHYYPLLCGGSENKPPGVRAFWYVYLILTFKTKYGRVGG